MSFINKKMLIFLELTTLFLIISTLTLINAQDYVVFSTVINFTLEQYVSINPSTTLLSGISFGQVYLGSSDVEAIGNAGTEYYLEVDPSTTSNVNFFDKIENELCEGKCIIYNRASNVSSTGPWSEKKIVSTTWKKLADECMNMQPGGICYIQFFLNVSFGIPAGTYTTTYYFCANSTNGYAIC